VVHFPIILSYSAARSNQSGILARYGFPEADLALTAGRNDGAGDNGMTEALQAAVVFTGSSHQGERSLS